VKAPPWSRVASGVLTGAFHKQISIEISKNGDQNSIPLVSGVDDLHRRSLTLELTAMKVSILNGSRTAAGFDLVAVTDASAPPAAAQALASDQVHLNVSGATVPAKAKPTWRLGGPATERNTCLSRVANARAVRDCFKVLRGSNPDE
jgi:hypothetical protein